MPSELTFFGSRWILLKIRWIALFVLLPLITAGPATAGASDVPIEQTTSAAKARSVRILDLPIQPTESLRIDSPPVPTVADTSVNERFIEGIATGRNRRRTKEREGRPPEAVPFPWFLLSLDERIVKEI